MPAPSSNGVIWGRANLGDDWVGTDIRGKLSARPIPVFMTNDGNAAALGEYALRHKHLGSLMLVAPGTGLGGGLVLPGGRGYEGVNGLALEVGHISVPFREDDGALPACSCGLKGCAEAWVSLMALRRRLRLELAKPEWADHPLNEGDAPIEEKAFRLRDFAEEGDALAVRFSNNRDSSSGSPSPTWCACSIPASSSSAAAWRKPRSATNTWSGSRKGSPTARGRFTATARWTQQGDHPFRMGDRRRCRGRHRHGLHRAGAGPVEE